MKRKKTGGRGPGVKNKQSSEVRQRGVEWLKECGTVTEMKRLYEAADDKKKWDMLMDGCKVWLPALKAIDVTHDMSDEAVTKVNKIIKVIMTGGNND